MSKRSWLSNRSPAFPAPTSSAARRELGDPARLRRLAEPAQVLDGLALGQLEDDVTRIETHPDDHPDQGMDAEVVHLEGPWREVDGERAGQPEPCCGLQDGVEAGDIEFGGPTGGLGSLEQRARTTKPLSGSGLYQSLEPARNAGVQVVESAGRRRGWRLSPRPARRARRARPAAGRRAGRRGAPGRRWSRRSGRDACSRRAPRPPASRAGPDPWPAPGWH